MTVKTTSKHGVRKRTGVTRAFFALRNSTDGFIAAWREESSFRQELIVFIALVPCAFLLNISSLERALLLITALLVLLVELINSSIEAAIDRISLERHELSKRAKDCGSAAVCVALLICALAWGSVCIPLVMRWVRAW
jgi:diacylglycerol kinase (ATP)